MESDMKEGAESPKSRDSVFVRARGDPYRQARQLLMLGMIRDQWLLLPGLENEAPAWQLANSLDSLVQRGLHGGSARMLDYRPRGTVIFGLHRLIQYANYQTWDMHRRVLNVAYMKAEENPYKQTREIVFSGVASKACIILYGPFNNVRELLYPLHETILRGSYNGVRIVEPRPLGMYVLTRQTLFMYADYSCRFSYKS
jgi:hypothetical protein